MDLFLKQPAFLCRIRTIQVETCALSALQFYKARLAAPGKVPSGLFLPYSFCRELCSPCPRLVDDLFPTQMPFVKNLFSPHPKSGLCFCCHCPRFTHQPASVYLVVFSVSLIYPLNSKFLELSLYSPVPMEIPHVVSRRMAG